jgi:hypothetical protein
VSRRCCAHSGAKLADNATCGARCDGFPACLPAVSPALAREITLALDAAISEHQAASAAHELLDRLHTAISDGLAREVVRDHPRPRW